MLVEHCPLSLPQSSYVPAAPRATSIIQGLKYKQAQLHNDISLEYFSINQIMDIPPKLKQNFYERHTPRKHTTPSPILYPPSINRSGKQATNLTILLIHVIPSPSLSPTIFSHRPTAVSFLVLRISHLHPGNPLGLFHASLEGHHLLLFCRVC